MIDGRVWSAGEVCDEVSMCVIFVMMTIATVGRISCYLEASQTLLPMVEYSYLVCTTKPIAQLIRKCGAYEEWIVCDIRIMVLVQ